MTEVQCTFMTRSHNYNLWNKFPTVPANFDWWGSQTNLKLLRSEKRQSALVSPMVPLLTLLLRTPAWLIPSKVPTVAKFTRSSHEEGLDCVGSHISYTTWWIICSCPDGAKGACLGRLNLSEGKCPNQVKLASSVALHILAHGNYKLTSLFCSNLLGLASVLWMCPKIHVIRLGRRKSAKLVQPSTPWSI